jgi:small neutral amino acid transporter SnatA (MarC family)
MLNRKIMKKISIIAFIAIASFASFGFVVLKKSNSQAIELENLEVAEPTHEFEPVQDSNDEIW